MQDTVGNRPGAIARIAHFFRSLLSSPKNGEGSGTNYIGQAGDPSIPTSPGETAHGSNERSALTDSVHFRDPEPQPFEDITDEDLADEEPGVAFTDRAVSSDPADLHSEADILEGKSEDTAALPRLPDEDVRAGQEEANEDLEPEAEGSGAEPDIGELVSRFTTRKSGTAVVPREFYRSMKQRYGYSRKTVDEVLAMRENGQALRRGDGKKILCAWVEAIIGQVGNGSLTVSEVRRSLPTFVTRAYGPNATSGFNWSVSKCEFLCLRRDGEVIKSQARAGDILSLC